MQAFPHRYKVRVEGEIENPVTNFADNLPALRVATPVEFDGPGDQWSPELLLMSSLASCLVLSFRAIAKASQLVWTSIECESEGELDKVDRTVRFTRVTTRSRLSIPRDQDIDKARRLLEKAHSACFISNSLSAESRFDDEVRFDDSQ